MSAPLPYAVEAALSARRFVAATYNGASDVAYVCRACSALVSDLRTHYGYAAIHALGDAHRDAWLAAARAWTEHEAAAGKDGTG